MLLPRAIVGLCSVAIIAGTSTVSSQSYPTKPIRIGYEAEPLQGLFAPARTPTTVINRLNQEVVRHISRADIKEKLHNAGTVAVGGSPEQFAARLKSEIARWGKVIKDVGIRAE